VGKANKFLMPSGMVGVLFYLAHTITGRLLWPEYDPITMDISSLTAVGAPNAESVKRLTFVYGICMLLFAFAMIKKSFSQYHSLLKTGSVVFMIMQLTSIVGYGLFPLTGDKTEMNFQNRMHVIVTAVVVITTIASAFLLAFGYLKQEKMKGLGKFTLPLAVLITLIGALTPISMGLQLNILGLTERLTIYSLQLLIFALSFFYTFLDNKGRDLKRSTKT
jgi:hypothetical protein